MERGLLSNLAALAALVPAALVHLRREPRRDSLFWAVLAVAVAGSLTQAALTLAGEWHTGLAATLWVSISATLLAFAVLAAIHREAWRLSPLLMPYLFLLGVAAAVWTHAPEQPLSATAPETWLGVHIAVSVLTYALATLAAVAGGAVVLQERALKRRRPTALTRVLPSVADGESLQIGLLVACECVLGAGIASGLATHYLEDGRLFDLDHKTLLSVLAFAVIGGLLVAHWRTGVRGRRAARAVLVAYLLLTLAFPGVKFVTDVVMG